MKVLRKRHGFAGVGMFWHLVEVCYENSGKIEEYKLPIIFEAENMEDGEKIWKTMLELRLFQKKDSFFYSERIDRELEIQEKLSKKRAEAGRAGGIAKSLSASKAKNPSNSKQVLASAKQSLAKSATGQDRTGHNMTLQSLGKKTNADVQKSEQVEERPPERIRLTDDDVEKQFFEIAISEQWCDGAYVEKTILQARQLGTENRVEYFRKLRVGLNAFRSSGESTRKLAKKMFHEIAGHVNDRGAMEKALTGKELAKRREFEIEENGAKYVESELESPAQSLQNWE